MIVLSAEQDESRLQYMCRYKIQCSSSEKTRTVVENLKMLSPLSPCVPYCPFYDGESSDQSPEKTSSMTLDELIENVTGVPITWAPQRPKAGPRRITSSANSRWVNKSSGLKPRKLDFSASLDDSSSDEELELAVPIEPGVFEELAKNEPEYSEKAEQCNDTPQQLFSTKMFSTPVNSRSSESTPSPVETSKFHFHGLSFDEVSKRKPGSSDRNSATLMRSKRQLSMDNVTESVKMKSVTMKRIRYL